MSQDTAGGKTVKRRTRIDRARTGTKPVIESLPSSRLNSLFRSHSSTNFFLSRRQVRDKPGFRKLPSLPELRGYPVIELANFFERREYSHRRQNFRKKWRSLPPVLLFEINCSKK